MIQDILPLRLRNEFVKKQPRKESRIMLFFGDQIYIKQSEELDFPTYGMLECWCRGKGIPVPQAVYLFAVGGEEYFLAELPEELKGAAEERFAFERMIKVRQKTPRERVFAAATAWHLYGWYRDNRFCGRCGQGLSHDGKLRMLSCPACRNQVFPKIAPAVIVGVTDGERLLMTKYANREYKRYALIAGFTEIGETAEQTVQREVLEEVGLHVRNIHYYKSQPWGFDQNLLLGYFCELDDTPEITLDTGELASAEWVHYKDIPEDAEGLSLTREMMTVFRDSFKKQAHDGVRPGNSSPGK